MIWIESVQDLKDNRDYIIQQIKLEGVTDPVIFKKVMARMVQYANEPETIEQNDWDCDDLILVSINDVGDGHQYVDHTSDLHRASARRQAGLDA